MEETIRDDEIEIDLMELLGVLWSKAWLIVLVGILTGAVGFAVSNFLITEKFQSRTSMYVMNRQNEATVTYSDLQSGTQLTKDYKELMTSRPVLEEVILNLGLSMNNEELENLIQVDTPSDTRIIQVTVTHTDPVMAQRIAAEFASAAAEQIQKVMDLESVNIYEEANYSDIPVSPSVKKYTVLGALIGMFFVCAILVLIYILDDTIKTSEDVEKYLGTGVIGVIPVAGSSSKGDKKKKSRGE